MLLQGLEVVEPVIILTLNTAIRTINQPGGRPVFLFDKHKLYKRYILLYIKNGKGYFR